MSNTEVPTPVYQWDSVKGTLTKELPTQQQTNKQTKKQTKQTNNHPTPKVTSEAEFLEWWRPVESGPVASEEWRHYLDVLNHYERYGASLQTTLHFLTKLTCEYQSLHQQLKDGAQSYEQLLGEHQEALQQAANFKEISRILGLQNKGLCDALDNRDAEDEKARRKVDLQREEERRRMDDEKEAVREKAIKEGEMRVRKVLEEELKVRMAKFEEQQRLEREEVEKKFTQKMAAQKEAHIKVLEVPMMEAKNETNRTISEQVEGGDDEEKQNYPCKSCDNSFKAPSYLKRHVLTHTGEKPYKCEECKKTFSQKVHLKNHTNIHTGERSYPCGKCGKEFSFKQNLRVHVEKKKSCEKKQKK